MTEVGQLLAAVADSTPVQRVRNYHLRDREASPRPRDFLIAMKRADGAVCLRWPGPAGVCFVRYADPGWECIGHNRLRGRTTVASVDAEVVTEWLRDGDPELVASDAVRGALDGECVGDVRTASGNRPTVPDGGQSRERATRVRVERNADLVSEPDLDVRDADALAVALPPPPGNVVFTLPLVLAEESVLEPVEGSDCVFVAEPVPDRETECAHYVRQSHRGCWVPKGEVTAYELADGATLVPDSAAGESNDLLESESA